MRLRDFDRFLGLVQGDRVTEVEKYIGFPDSVYDNPENHFFVYYYQYYNIDILSISFDRETEKVETIFLGNDKRVRYTFEWLDAYRIDDPKTNLLDKHIDEIIDIFGRPDEEEEDDFIYITPDFKVVFYCPAKKDFYCQKILLYWE
ncbi:MAG: hypothetical protein N2Z72_08315 [Bacteroidales bacterium]|nr:hypothetical protein [Bacteroidales bacterium]